MHAAVREMIAKTRAGAKLTLVGALLSSSTLAFAPSSRLRSVATRIEDHGVALNNKRPSIMTGSRTISSLKASNIPPNGSNGEDPLMSYGERSRIFRRDVFGCKFMRFRCRCGEGMDEVHCGFGCSGVGNGPNPPAASSKTRPQPLILWANFRTFFVKVHR